MKECETCESCYTCEKSVISSITKEQLDEAKKKGGIPSEWLRDLDCENCFSCQKCDTSQEVDKCGNCYACQKCDTHQGNAGDGLNNCENCFSCQKCVSQQANCENCYTCQVGDVSNDSCKGGVCKVKKDEDYVNNITYFLFPTNNCNLRCTYCYATKTPKEMDAETLAQAGEFILGPEEERNPGRRVNIQFFGGEPMLKWNMLTTFIDWMNEEARKRLGRKINWGMTTNGTLLNEERIKWMKEHNLRPLLSVDGRKETHNKHRIYANGRGSFDDIPFDTFLKYFPNPELRPTILPDTVEGWIEDLYWFHSKGCYNVATEVAYEADWDDEAMAKAWRTYDKMGDIYIQFRKAGKKDFWMKFIMDGLNTLGIERQTGTVCGIARNTVAIDAHGWLYACQRYADFNNPDLKIGDIWEGWDYDKLKEWRSLRREHMYPDPRSGFDCETCPARWKCRGGCNAMNYQCNNDRKMILENHCKFQRMWALITLRVLSATGELHRKIRR